MEDIVPSLTSSCGCNLGEKGQKRSRMSMALNPS